MCLDEYFLIREIYFSMLSWVCTLFALLCLSAYFKMTSSVVFPNWLKRTGAYIYSQWFFVILGCLIAIAHSYPHFASHGGIIKAEYTIGYGAVAVIFLLSGLDTEAEKLKINLFNWKAHLTVLVYSFLITSSIAYGIITAINAVGNKNIDQWMLVGLIVTMSCPTTVASNVIMTKNADGNELLTLCEVFIGNILGAFITPALTQLYLGDDTPWGFANPKNFMGGSIGKIYANVLKQVSLTVFLPLIVGQITRYLFYGIVTKVMKMLKPFKIGSWMLLMIMFSSFSTAFEQHSFQSVPPESLIFICFFNFAIYMFFTALCFFTCRFPLPSKSSKFYLILEKLRYNKSDSVSIMLCAPAKTAALGVTLISSQYGNSNPNLGKLLVPLVLYQSEQVFCAGILVQFLKKWVAKDKTELNDDEALQTSDSNTDSNDNSETTIISGILPDSLESPGPSKIVGYVNTRNV